MLSTGCSNPYEPKGGGETVGKGASSLDSSARAGVNWVDMLSRWL